MSRQLIPFRYQSIYHITKIGRCQEVSRISNPRKVNISTSMTFERHIQTAALKHGMIKDGFQTGSFFELTKFSFVLNNLAQPNSIARIDTAYISKITI